jgi:hypothetical protein
MAWLGLVRIAGLMLVLQVLARSVTAFGLGDGCFGHQTMHGKKVKLSIMQRQY